MREIIFKYKIGSASVRGKEMIHTNTIHGHMRIMIYMIFALILVQCEDNSPTENNSPLQSAPTVSTTSAAGITSTSAGLNGTVNPNGSQTDTWFEYGTNSSLSSYTTTSQGSAGNGSSVVNIDQDLSGLTPGENYYFRIAASNEAGISKGSIRSFKTLLSYTSVTGSWNFETRSDFGNSDFTASLRINNLSLTQTNEVLYTNVNRLTGTISGMFLTLQRKSDGALYSVFNNATSGISNGAINTSLTSHNLSFYIAGSSDFSVQGVASGYLDMFGDVTIKLNMTALFGTADGNITLTGYWDGTRN